MFSEGIGDLVNTTNRLACKFYTHGVCVSFIMERFKRDETKCIPACDSYQFHMENLHVSQGFRSSYQLYVFQYLKENVDYQSQLRNQLHLDKDIAMHSVRDSRTNPMIEVYLLTDS